MEDLVASLVAAERALAEDRRGDALATLLEAWRAVRHPRIANLIDYVSDELVAKQPPIKGKTLAARMKVWNELEQQRDPAVLGRLLATPWPGTWQGALAMLEPLLSWPDDPRLSLSFARVVEACPYDTWTSSKFYHPLIHKLEEQRDLRVLHLLRSQLDATHSHYYKRSVRPLVVRTIKDLETLYPDDQPPALTPDAEAALRAIEARYRDRIEGEHEKVAGEAEHVAAILADPDDTAARAVYADWLGERGDPRGELITLQLARANGAATDAALARERKLIEEHGKRWAGALDAWLDETGRSFEGGFLAGGLLRWRYQYGPDFTIDKMLSDPAWALVRRLDSRGEDELLLQLLDRPELRSLREVHVTFNGAASIASGPPRAFTSLHWTTGWNATAPLDVLSTIDALPALTEIGFTTTNYAGHTAWLEAAPVLERVHRIVLREARTQFLEAAATRGGALREIELDLQRIDRRDEGWRFVLQRESAPGPFTKLVARPRGGPHDPSSLAPVLEAIPQGWLTELIVTSPKKLAMPKQERARLVAAIERFPIARRELPWNDLIEAAPVVAKAPDGPLLYLRVDGVSLFKPELAAPVWQLVNDELGLGYDSFEIGSKWRSLGNDPIARIQKWAGNARCYDMTLFRDGAPGTLRLTRSKYRESSMTLLEAPLALRTPEQWVEWFLRFVELGTFDSGNVFLSQVDRHYRSFDLGTLGCAASAGWLIYFGPQQRPLLPPDELAALSRKPGLDGAFARATSTGVLVGAAASPHELTPARLVALAAALREILKASLERRFGYSLEERVVHALGEQAAQHGMAHVPADDHQLQVRFASPDGKRQLDVLMYSAYAKPAIRVQIHSSEMGRNWYQELGDGTPAGTRAEVDEALARTASLMRQYAGAFFADPESSRRYR